jgi:alkylation response protein AidB-like acyl-CoA dehydrogenase
MSGMAGEDAAIRAEALSWLRENWDPDLSVRDWWTRLAESSWGFPAWPRDWFGRGLRAEQAAAVRDAFFEVGAIGPPGSLGQRLGGPTLLTHARRELLEQFLPELAYGREYWCQYFSEPGAGSDLAGLQTRAVRDGDEWIINGQKVWTSGAQYADRAMLLARTDPDVPKHQGLTYFIIDMDQTGIEVRPLHQMNDARGFNETFFTDARVSNDRIVGKLNDGWSVALTTLMYERFGGAVPSAQPGKRLAMLDRRAGDVASGRARHEREGLGMTNIAETVIEVARTLERDTDPVVRQRLAQLYAAEEVQRLGGLRSTAARRTGEGPGPGGSVGKIARSNLSRLTREVGMEVLGANGMLVGRDTPGDGRLQYAALSSPGSSIAGGTDEIQHNIIGERVLGLPKEPRLDAHVPFRELKTGTQARPD